MKLVSQMLTQIRNALMVRKEKVAVPFSNFNFSAASVLSAGGFLGSVIIKKGRGAKAELEILLKYDEKGKPLISGIKQVSKSGQRIYKGYKEMRKVKGGRGLSLISTPKGVMSDKEAHKRKLGGEVICEVW